MKNNEKTNPQIPAPMQMPWEDDEEYQLNLLSEFGWNMNTPKIKEKENGDKMKENIIKRILIADAYKYTHGMMYPQNTTNLYSILTARKSFDDKFEDFYWLHDEMSDTVFEIIQDWTSSVSILTTDELRTLGGVLSKSMGNYVAFDFIEKLKSVRSYLYTNQTLPITIEIAKTNKYMKFQQPLITITGNPGIGPQFVWLINFFETAILQGIWYRVTTLTIARDLYELGQLGAVKTSDLSLGEMDKAVRLQFHDFSRRGISSNESAQISARSHLHFFDGSDSLDSSPNAKSVPATEHSVMMALGKEGEEETFKNLLEKFPTGTLSIVSDTWDIYNVVNNILPKFKKEILARKGKIVIRPDSGKPIDIICGTKEQPGMLELLEKTFGSTTNKKGYKELNPKIGLIYGDGLTLESIEEIMDRMIEQGWATLNVIFGIGAFVYQFITRDTLGFAMKATAIEFDNWGWVDLIKDPITDPGKKSLTGRIKVK